MDHEHDRKQLDRLTFFSDAVFAIAMTLLVIEVRLPATELSAAALGQALVGLIPKYLGFVISFLVIGRFWIAHHRVFGLLAGTSEQLNWVNLLLLMVVAFMPFPTEVISEFSEVRLAVMLYAGWLTVLGLLHHWLVRTALRRPGLVRDDVPEAECRHLRRGSLIPVVIGLLSLAGAAVAPLAGIAILFLGSPVVSWLLHRRERPHPDAGADDAPHANTSASGAAAPPS